MVCRLRNAPLLACAWCVACLLLSKPTQGQPQPNPTEAPLLIPPEVLRRVDPVYPPQALKERKTGEVVLQLDIDREGRVTAAVVRQGIGYGMDESAQAAALQLLFKPARRSGNPIPSRILYKMSFTLAPEPTPRSDPAPTTPIAPARFQGLVRLGQTDTSVAGAHIQLKLSDGRVVETLTDGNGHFSVEPVPPGTVLIQVYSPGYQLIHAEDRVNAGELVSAKYRLRPLGAPLEVRVRGERADREVTRRTMSRQELNLIPGTGGDALRAIQSMPGIGRTAMLSGMIVVRGSSPYGTRTSVDGTIVPQIYHFGGLSSIIPTEMIESLDFYPGNFSAKYGRVTGGIIDVKLREIAQEKSYHGLAQVDLVDVRTMLRGPVPLLKNWAFVVGFRRSHLDAWIGRLMSDSDFRTAPVYYDWQAFVETKPTSKSTFRLGCFGADDRLEMIVKTALTSDARAGNSIEAGLRTLRFQAFYRNQISDALSANAVAAVGYDRERSLFGSLSDTTLNYIPLVFRGDLAYRASKQLLLRVGPDVVAYHYEADVRSPRPSDPGEWPDSVSSRPTLRLKEEGYYSTPAAFAEAEWTPNQRAKLVFGGRLDYFNVTNQWDLSPRFNARYDLHTGHQRTTAKLGFGLFYEPPIITQSLEPFGTPTLLSNRAIHSSVGLEQEVSERVEVAVEVFHKLLDHLVVREEKADGSTGYNNTGSGSVLGTETLVRWKPGGRFFGWIAYTNSRSLRKDGPGLPQRLFEFDQSHILTVLGSYDFGRGWRLGTRFRYVTGNPYTPCSGGYLNGATGAYDCIPGLPYSRRIPTYHQLDIRADKTWSFRTWKLTAYVDIYNAYNRENAEGIRYNLDYTKAKVRKGLPLIPSLGLRGEF